MINERPKCPFYGFQFMMEILIDTDGNQCALKRDSHSPCYMEIKGQNPYWNDCSYNNPGAAEGIEKLKEKGLEVHPEGERPLSFNKWYDRIMLDKLIPE